MIIGELSHKQLFTSPALRISENWIGVKTKRRKELKERKSEKNCKICEGKRFDKKQTVEYEKV